MNHTLKKLEKSQIELTITVSPADYQKNLENAAVRISERANIKGFRKGHVPYEIVKKEVGEMNILQEALESVVQSSFYDAVKAEKIETIGMPKVSITKVAPGNDIVFTAVAATMPAIHLPKFESIKIKQKKAEVPAEKTDIVINDLRKMRSKEIIKKGVATQNDKVMIDMDMLLENVPVEGGQAKDYGVFLNEDHYVPGFNKELIGAKAGEEKKFSLDFPKTHYQKMLAGKKVDFKVKVKDVYEIQLADLNDEFAKLLGQESVAKLRDLVSDNLLKEAEQKNEQQLEIEMLEKVIEKTDFDVLPDVIIDAEKQKMFFELKSNLEKNGVTIEQYLSDIKKKEAELFKDFAEQAEKRAKAALVSREIAKTEKLNVDHEEIHQEIDMMKEIYKDNKEYLDNLERHEVHDAIANMLLNKKVLAWLKEKIVEKQTDSKK